MHFVRNLSALLFIIALPVALIMTNIRVTVNEPRLFEYAIDNYGGPEASGIERSELLRGGDELRAYFNNDDDEIFVRVQEDGRSVSLFNARETQHLRDVKTLFQSSFLVQEGAVLFILAYVVGVFIWARERSLQTLARQVLLSGLLSLVVVGALGAIAVAGFDAAFERFHLIAFDNDLWRLSPRRDHLIQMFPQAFWQDVSVLIGIVTAAQLAALGLVSALYLGVTRRGSEDSYPVAGEARMQTQP